MAGPGTGQPIPAHPLELTAEWLTEALAERHHGIVVASVDVTDVRPGASTPMRLPVLSRVWPGCTSDTRIRPGVWPRRRGCPRPRMAGATAPRSCATASITYTVPACCQIVTFPVDAIESRRVFAAAFLSRAEAALADLEARKAVDEQLSR